MYIHAYIILKEKIVYMHLHICTCVYNILTIAFIYTNT